MSYLCVNKNGQELICPDKPVRLGFIKVRCSDLKNGFYLERAYSWDANKIKKEDLSYWDCSEVCSCEDFRSFLECELPSGSIERLIGKVLTWEDEPVKL